eukprot:8950540-Alexandrium_andersonii.AAC.1
MCSASSLKPRAARGQLRVDVASEAGFRGPFHLTPEVARAVVAILVSAGYRSAVSILPVAKQRRVHAGR